MLLVSVSGCGGSKVLKEPEPLVLTQPLVAASNEGFSVTLDWVIVRDGPGTQIETGESRSQLVKATKTAKRRYKGEGLTVQAGAGVATLVAGGTALALGSVAVGWGATGASDLVASGGESR